MHLGCDAMQSTEEKLAMYLGGIGFVLMLVGIFLPWGAYETLTYPPPSQPEVRWFSGLTWTSGSYLMIGLVVAVAGLLGSAVKASKFTVAVLGAGALLIILGTGLFISSYYENLYGYPQIVNISTGSFVTLIGGICEILAAFLYTQYARVLPAKISSEEVHG